MMLHMGAEDDGPFIFFNRQFIFEWLRDLESENTLELIDNICHTTTTCDQRITDIGIDMSFDYLLSLVIGLRHKCACE